MKKSYNYKDLLNQYIKQDKSNPEGLFQLALMYFYGNNYPRDYDKTISIINDIGPIYPQAYTFLGLAYLQGEVFEKDINKAIDYLSKAADKGNDDAIIFLSSIYLYTDYVPRNLEKAIELLEKGISLGHDNAMVQLGLIYMNSPIDDDSPQKAFQLFSKADSLGNPNAASFLGIMYEKGEYVSEDKRKAFQYFLKGSSGNSEVGHFFLGKSYYQGEIVKQNTEEAMNHFLIAANLGYTQAIYQLIDIYFNDLDYFDIEKGRKLIDVLIEKNDPYGFYFLGSIQIEGNHFPQDINEGIENLKKAQIDDAFFLLGQIYYHGISIEVDEIQALFYFRKSIDHGNIDAMVEAAEIIIKNNLNENYLSLLKEANDYYHPKGTALLGECYLFGRTVKPDIKKAFSLFIKAAKQKNNIAYRYLGFCYQFGINVPKDKKKAINYYYKAINNHDIDAAALLHVINDDLGIGKIAIDDRNIYKEYLTLAANLGNEEAKELLTLIDD